MEFLAAALWASLDVGDAGPPLTLLGTLGGVWGVIRLFDKYQADFTKRYRAELVIERQKREEAEADLDTERQARYAAELQNNHLLGILARNNIDPITGALRA